MPEARAHHDILPNRKFVQRPDDLMRARHSHAGQLVRFETSHIPVAEDDASLFRRVNAVDGVEEVVLPAPFGPINPRICPSGRSKVTFVKACNPPKRLETPCTERGWSCQHPPQSREPAPQPANQPRRNEQNDYEQQDAGNHQLKVLESKVPIMALLVTNLLRSRWYPSAPRIGPRRVPCPPSMIITSDSIEKWSRNASAGSTFPFLK